MLKKQNGKSALPLGKAVFNETKNIFIKK